MSRPLPFTQASLRRAIDAARKAGLRVMSIRPDGTIVVHDGENAPGVVPESGLDAQVIRPSKWEDAEA
jgi:hypothetical protein